MATAHWLPSRDRQREPAPKKPAQRIIVDVATTTSVCKSTSAAPTLALAAAVLAAVALPAATADPAADCTSEAMIVFDASGSMTGTNFNGIAVPRIVKVREAIHRVIPHVSAYRNLGLIVYGPGPHQTCSNVELKLAPVPNAGPRIIAEIDRLQPDGETPLTSAVREAAEMLRHRQRPATIVLLTDGEENCGGAPCALAETLKAESPMVTVHVIGFREADKLGRLDGFASRCLADITGGTYTLTETTDELVAALQKTLSCPQLTARE
jgi:Ca-activated chloride channel family protein